MNELEFDKKIYFTYDLLQLEKDLSKSWFEFVRTEDRNKITNIRYRIIKIRRKIEKNRIKVNFKRFSVQIEENLLVLKNAKI